MVWLSDGKNFDDTFNRFYRAMLRRARYYHGKSSVCLSA